MSTTMLLSDLMVAVRQRADMLPAAYTATTNGTSYFVTDVELISYINQSYYELYDLLVAAYGADYFNKAPPATFTADGTSALYPLPADLYKLRGLDVQLSGSSTTWLTVPTFEFRERNRFSAPSFQGLGGRSNLRYRLSGSNFWLTPTPAAGLLFQVWYVPRLTPLAALSDTMDGISGWTEYVICDAAIKCLQKEESDISALMAEKAALKVRIEAMAEGRDAGAPPKVTDAISNECWSPDGPWGGGSGNY